MDSQNTKITLKIIIHLNGWELGSINKSPILSNLPLNSNSYSINNELVRWLDLSLQFLFYLSFHSLLCSSFTQNNLIFDFKLKKTSHHPLIHHLLPPKTYAQRSPGLWKHYSVETAPSPWGNVVLLDAHSCKQWANMKHVCQYFYCHTDITFCWISTPSLKPSLHLPFSH